MRVHIYLSYSGGYMITLSSISFLQSYVSSHVSSYHYEPYYLIEVFKFLLRIFLNTRDSLESLRRVNDSIPNTAVDAFLHRHL
jgi:hypothetical protein